MVKREQMSKSYVVVGDFAAVRSYSTHGHYNPKYPWHTLKIDEYFVYEHDSARYVQIKVSAWNKRLRPKRFVCVILDSEYRVYRTR